MCLSVYCAKGIKLDSVYTRNRLAIYSVIYEAREERIETFINYRTLYFNKLCLALCWIRPNVKRIGGGRYPSQCLQRKTDKLGSSHINHNYIEEKFYKSRVKFAIIFFFVSVFLFRLHTNFIPLKETEKFHNHSLWSGLSFSLIRRNL